MTARQAAADVLHRSVSRDGFVADLIDDQLVSDPVWVPLIEAWWRSDRDLDALAAERRWPVLG